MDAISKKRTPRHWHPRENKVIQ